MGLGATTKSLRRHIRRDSKKMKQLGVELRTTETDSRHDKEHLKKGKAWDFGDSRRKRRDLRKGWSQMAWPPCSSPQRIMRI